MKAIPNIISVGRIVLSIALLKVEPLSGVFWILYIGCGLSDMADGYIARKTSNTSELGAKLDSIADFVMIVVAVIIFYPLVKPNYLILFWVLGIAAVRLLAVLIAYIKFSTFAMLHTYANKLTGLLLFIFPFGMTILPANITMGIVCLVATISALEEFVIQVRSKNLDLNRKSIYVPNNEGQTENLN